MLQRLPIERMKLARKIESKDSHSTLTTASTSCIVFGHLT